MDEPEIFISVPYSVKTAITNEKTEIIFEIEELHSYPRHLYPLGIVNNAISPLYQYQPSITKEDR